MLERFRERIGDGIQTALERAQRTRQRIADSPRAAREWAGSKAEQTAEWARSHGRRFMHDPWGEWQRVKPITYAGAMFLGVGQLFEGLDPYMDAVTMPIADMLGGPSGFFADNLESIIELSVGGLIGKRTYDHFKQDSARERQKPRNWRRSARGALAVMTMPPLLAIGLVRERPDVLRDIPQRLTSYAFTTFEQPDGQYIAELGDHLREEGLDKERIEHDARALRRLGYDITARDLHTLTRVVEGESGNYYFKRDFRQAQFDDMEAISNVILNRYLASRNEETFKRYFNGDGEVSFGNVVLHHKQFSIANSNARRREWQEALRGDPLDGVRDRGKGLMAYAALIETLAGACDDAHDPTGGALWYKNNSVGYAARKQWDGLHFAHGEMQRGREIQAHTHYTLLRDGQNVASRLRHNFTR